MSRLVRVRLVPAGLVVLLLGVASGEEESFPQYQWSINSGGYPTGPPFLGEKDLNLWLDCADLPASAAQMDVIGTLEAIAFLPASGVTNTATLPTLDLSFSPCIGRPLPYWTFVGTLTVRDTLGIGGRLCLSGTNVTRNCLQGTDHANSYRGFSTDGTPPCYVGGCPVDYALPDTWGRVKALYAR